MSIEPAQFREAMSRFATGVTVVTSRLGEHCHGMTVNSFTSVSLRPPLVLFCASAGCRTLDMIERSGVYAVNVLRHEQRSLSDRFAGRLGIPETDRFAGLEYELGGATGCPLFIDALASLECRLVALHPAGDHVILVAEPISVIHRLGEPLLYFASGYRAVAENSPRPDSVGT